MNNFITLDGIGLVHFYKSKKAKRLIISISKNNEIKVAVPIRIDLNKAVDFAQSKKDWIKINKCLAASQAILIEETSKAYVANLEIDEWKQETSKLNMDKYNRDNNCKDKGYF